jgi:CRISPR/Cas system-associated exonuclease Cas4 (RecB family)
VGPDEQWVEVERRVRFMEGEEELYNGTTDIIACRQDGSIVVIDWKTGIYELDSVQDNLQMKAYVLAIMQEFSVKSVSVYIYYPNLNKRSQFTFNNESELETEIRGIITSSKSEGSQLTPGGNQCFFCRAKAYNKCPEYVGY